MARTKVRRRLALAALLLLLGLAGCFGRPSYLWLNAWVHDKPVAEPLPAGMADDASRMNRTAVAEVWPVPEDPAEAEAQLRWLLERARRERLAVSVAGARHSMGGHTIAPDGIVVNMLPFRRLELDADRQILHTGSGARWSEVIPYLDARGLSVAVMQSNNDFSVGGSVSVNCHGWQHNSPPIASTVESFRLMTADGVVHRCSRTEEPELFWLALGGYGLFGIILDVDLRVVPNERYKPELETVSADDYVNRFRQRVDRAADVGMVYGRLCVTPGDRTFLREALLTVFRRSPCPPKDIPALKSPGYTLLRREVYRAQIGSDAGKQTRWRAEKVLGEQITRRYFSRNQLLDEGAEVYRERNADRTDILHEYFVPPEQVPAFLAKARHIIPRHVGDLLNVTIRSVLEDRDTFLRYADRDVFGFVMLFSQARTPEGDRNMGDMTRELIDAAINCGGRYYLPYRLHASVAQMRAGYPRAAEFFERKRVYDPGKVFRNQFYVKYGQP